MLKRLMNHINSGFSVFISVQESRTSTFSINFHSIIGSFCLIGFHFIISKFSVIAFFFTSGAA